MKWITWNRIAFALTGVLAWPHLRLQKRRIEFIAGGSEKADVRAEFAVIDRAFAALETVGRETPEIALRAYLATKRRSPPADIKSRMKFRRLRARREEALRLYAIQCSVRQAQVQELLARTALEKRDEEES